MERNYNDKSLKSEHIAQEKYAETKKFMINYHIRT